MKNNEKLNKQLRILLIELTGKKKIENFQISNSLDSIQILNLILKLEKKFKIKIKNQYINEKNFKNLLSIKKIILKILHENKK
jgi:acyl carrier protein